MTEMLYTIKDVAERTGMSPSTLRFYDKKGLLTFVKRSAGGIRMFTEEDFEPLFVIDCLKRSGMALKDIKVFIDLYLQGDSTITQRRVLFEKQRDEIRGRIAELQEMLNIVEYKCWFFSEAEKYGDARYFEKLPPEQVPEPIREFYTKVNTFRHRQLDGKTQE